MTNNFTVLKLRVGPRIVPKLYPQSLTPWAGLVFTNVDTAGAECPLLTTGKAGKWTSSQQSSAPPEDCPTASKLQPRMQSSRPLGKDLENRLQRIFNHQPSSVPTELIAFGVPR